MRPIQLIIFSKDRAAQLDLLLRSIDKHCPNLFQTYVVYTFSDREYRRGYDRIGDTHKNVTMVLEKGFNKTVMSLTNLANEYICYSTDDTVFFKPVRETNLIDELKLVRQDRIFSLRLGLNTIKQDIHRDIYQPPLLGYHEQNEILTWNINKYHPHSNYGYPFALDVHIMPTKLTKEILPEFSWKNPTQLEGGMTAFRSKITYMSSFKESVAVNIPANNVGGCTVNGQFFPADVKKLNNDFLEGKKISLDNIEKQKIIGCHQEFELKYE